MNKVKFFITEDHREEYSHCYDDYEARVLFSWLETIETPFEAEPKEFRAICSAANYINRARLQSEPKIQIISTTDSLGEPLTPESILKERDNLEKAKQERLNKKEAAKKKAAATRKAKALAKKKATLEKLKKELEDES